MMTTTTLRSLRESMRPKCSQEEIARAANISLSGYRQAEAGKPLLYSTAQAVATGMNEARKRRGLAPLEFSEMGMLLA